MRAALRVVSAGLAAAVWGPEMQTAQATATATATTATTATTTTTATATTTATTATATATTATTATATTVTATATSGACTSNTMLKAAKQQSSKAAKQQSSKAAKQQSSKAARQQGSKAARQSRKNEETKKEQWARDRPMLKGESRRCSTIRSGCRARPAFTAIGSSTTLL
ncbi:hypothetical protein VC273_00055 [Xanthomonas nasturtii]|uniref:hypothetical protein n=1 Tax=Xanthomonas TaxID=338 RepID=UPI002B22DB1A|nr:hypothetical protein [Xanthomonas nasturtii]MEA9554372.1 hypothetical protein [Xanthomonas nasturtii]